MPFPVPAQSSDTCSRSAGAAWRGQRAIPSHGSDAYALPWSVRRSLVRRRELMATLGGAAFAWPLLGRTQQLKKMRRIGVLMLLAAEDAVAKARIVTFRQSLRQLGWIDGDNLQIDYGWSTGDSDQVRKDAADLVALAPDVLLATGSSSVAALQQATRTVPIVFALVSDPVGAGFVDSLPRPGGNATGFINFEYVMSAKWLELLKQIAPGLTRVAVLRDSAIAAGAGQLGAMQAVAPSLGVELNPIGVRVVSEIVRSVAAFAGSAG